MSGILEVSVWTRIAVVVVPLIAIMWADTVIERYWPRLAPRARGRWRNAQKWVIEPLLPLDAGRAGPVWPLSRMVDVRRFLERPGTYLGRMGVLVLACTAVHYWDRARGLTVLWALSYFSWVFVMLVMIAGCDVWGEYAGQDLS